MELRITVDVAVSERHGSQPLTRAQVERVIALGERLERAVTEVLAEPAEAPLR